MTSYPMRRAGQLVLLALIFVCQIHLQAQFSGAASSGSAFSIPHAQLMQPEELNALLRARGVQKPFVLQVGSRVLFAQAHIPGAEFAGPKLLLDLGFSNVKVLYIADNFGTNWVDKGFSVEQNR